MYAYILRRLLLIIPTLFGIMIINFAVVQFVPGGPVEQMIARLSGDAVSATARVGGNAGSETAPCAYRQRWVRVIEGFKGAPRTVPAASKG